MTDGYHLWKFLKDNCLLWKFRIPGEHPDDDYPPHGFRLNTWDILADRIYSKEAEEMYTEWHERTRDRGTYPEWHNLSGEAREEWEILAGKMRKFSHDWKEKS